MSDLSMLIKDISPANEQVGVPLRTDIVFTLSGLDYDNTSIEEGLFVEGPDTDQFVGPGLLELRDGNVSQGDLDDFLMSPGYKGIVQGTTTVSGIAGDTVVTFVSTYPMTPLTEYIINLTGVLDSLSNDIDGFVTSSFVTGSGSIEELPSTSSSTVLNAAISEAGAGVSSDAQFEAIKSTPADHAVNVATDLDEIVLEFNKPINPVSVAANVNVKTVASTDHPNATATVAGDLAITTEIEGNKLRIKI